MELLHERNDAPTHADAMLVLSQNRVGSSGSADSAACDSGEAGTGRQLMAKPIWHKSASYWHELAARLAPLRLLMPLCLAHRRVQAPIRVGSVVRIRQLHARRVDASSSGEGEGPRGKRDGCSSRGGGRHVGSAWKKEHRAERAATGMRHERREFGTMNLNLLR